MSRKTPGKCTFLFSQPYLCPPSRPAPTPTPLEVKPTRAGNCNHEGASDPAIAPYPRSFCSLVPMRRKGKRVEGEESTVSSLLPTRSARATRLRATPLLSFFAIATCVISLVLILARNGPRRNPITHVLGQPQRGHVNATFSHRANPDDAVKLAHLQ